MFAIVRIGSRSRAPRGACKGGVGSSPNNWGELSRAFADFVESDFDLEHVGEYPVRGFSEPPAEISA
jgi:hypothetical protein